MSAKIIIPHVGATGGDVRILIWLVRQGDFVTAGTPLVTIETDKATEDIEAFSDGYVDEILADAGSDVAVGSVIATLRESGEESDLGTETHDSSLAEKELPYQQLHPSASPEQPKSIAEAGRVFASPAARRLAREENVDLSSLNSDGRFRTIHLAHVRQAISSRASCSSPVKALRSTPANRQNDAPGERPTLEPASPAITRGDQLISNGSAPTLSRVRSVIAQRVTQSKTEIPHFYLSMTVDMTEAMLARAWLLKATEISSVAGPTINDLIVRATAFALRDTPQLNTLFRNDNLEALPSIDVGIVVGTEDTLLIPIVQNADLLNIYSLAESTRALKIGALEGTLTNRELTGGAISVSNLGMHGVDSFTAIIDPAQSSILACGAVRQSPAVHNGQVVIREQMTVTLSVDHRIADGVLAAKFLSRFKHYLEVPQLLITGKESHGK